MRVIFLTHNYPRYPGDLPGGFLHTLATAIRATGVDLRVVAPADRGRGGREELEGIPVRRVRYAPAAWETLAYAGQFARSVAGPRGVMALAGLWRALARGARAEALGAPGQSVVHAHWWFPAGAAAPRELPRVVTLHGTDGRLLQGSGLARWLGKRVLARAEVVTTVSGPLAGIVKAATGRVVPPEAIQPLPARLEGFRRSGGGGGVVSVSRFTPQKRLGLLVEAMAHLRDAGREIPLTLAGDGEDRERVEQLVAERGLGSLVRFSGTLPPSGVADLLGTADLFVVPARAEGYGLAAAEALISGVPVVACRDGGGLVDVVPDSGGGRLVEPDPAHLATAMTELLTDPSAPAAAWRSGQLLRERLAPAEAAARAVRWYEQALALHR